MSPRAKAPLWVVIEWLDGESADRVAHVFADKRKANAAARFINNTGSLCADVLEAPLTTDYKAWRRDAQAFLDELEGK